MPNTQQSIQTARCTHSLGAEYGASVRCRRIRTPQLNNALSIMRLLALDHAAATGMLATILLRRTLVLVEAFLIRLLKRALVRRRTRAQLRLQRAFLSRPGRVLDPTVVIPERDGVGNIVRQAPIAVFIEVYVVAIDMVVYRRRRVGVEDVVVHAYCTLAINDHVDVSVPLNNPALDIRDLRAEERSDGRDMGDDDEGVGCDDPGDMYHARKLAACHLELAPSGTRHDVLSPGHDDNYIGVRAGCTTLDELLVDILDAISLVPFGLLPLGALLATALRANKLYISTLEALDEVFSVARALSTLDA